RSPPLRAPDRRQINARPACITPHLFLFLLYLSLSPRRPKSARASLPAPLFAHLPSIRHPSLPAGRKIKIKRKEKDPPVPSSFETTFIPSPAHGPHVAPLHLRARGLSGVRAHRQGSFATAHAADVGLQRHLRHPRGRCDHRGRHG